MAESPELAEVRRSAKDIQQLVERHEPIMAIATGRQINAIITAAERMAEERDALRDYAQKMEAWVIRDTARLGGDTEGMANELREAAGVTSLLSHDDGEENDVALTDRAE